VLDDALHKLLYENNKTFKEIFIQSNLAIDCRKAQIQSISCTRQQMFFSACYQVIYERNMYSIFNQCFLMSSDETLKKMLRNENMIIKTRKYGSEKSNLQ
jgi:hypothetical protein